MFTNSSVEVKIKGVSVKIHAISTGMVSLKSSVKEASRKGILAKLDLIFDKTFTEWMPIWVWVIEHPEGIYMIDTGVNADVTDSNYFKSSGFFANWLNKRTFKFTISREQEIDRQLLKININPADVKFVVLTHLHLDHVDGVRHFRKAKIVVHKLEWDNPFGDLPKLYPEWFKPELIELNETYQNFDKAFYMTNSRDLIAIHTPGHTHGSISVILKTDDCDIAFAGDVCYQQQQLINDKHAGIDVSYSFTKDTYHKFKLLSKIRKLVFLPSHDKEAGRRLKKFIPLSVSY